MEALIVGLHLRWDGVWQRPNHVVARLAERVPVLVVEEPRAAPADENTFAVHGRVTVLTPHRRAITDMVDASTARATREWLGERAPAVWLYSPMMLPLADAFPDAPLVYDKMDQLSAFLYADPRLGEREDALLERASAVFAGGASLWETVRQRVRRGRALPSGVDVAHFEAALTAVPHAELRELQRPVFGYIGVIDERLDLALIERLADARPDATIVMVGPIAKIPPEALPRRPNITYLGKRTYDELPALLAGFDVALMPFAIGPTTELISPTKTLEYLAAGRPVVSTPITDVVGAFADVVHIAGADAFVEAVAAAEGQAVTARDAGIKRAHLMSWDGIVESMLAELEEAGVTLPRPAVAHEAG